MKKRILAFLLSCLIVFGACPFSALAQKTEQAIHAEQLIEALLGEKFFGAEDAEVSRLAFTKTLISLLGLSVTANEDNCIFEDVEAENRHTVNQAVNLKLVSAGHLFRPNAGILYAEALKMCMVAIGYESECAYLGGYPTGVLLAANRAKIMRKSSLNADTVLSGADALELLYEILNADMMLQVSVSDRDVYKQKDGVSLLSKYQSVTRVEGIIKENSRTALSYVKNEKENEIIIGSFSYPCDEKTEDYIGYRAEVYVQEQNGELKVLAAFPFKNTTAELTGYEIEEFKDLTITYLAENGEEEEYELADNYDVIYNGKAYTKAVGEELIKNCERIILIDNDNDGEYDVIKLEQYQYLIASNVDYIKRVIYSNNALSKQIDLQDSEAEYSVYDAEGNRIELYHISSGDFVAALVSEDGKYAKIYKSESIVSGSVQGVSTDDNKIVIDGNEYKMSPEFSDFYNSLSAANGGAFYLGTDGRVVLYEEMDSKDIRYGYLIATDKKGAFDDYVVKLLGDDGKIKILEMDERVKLDGEKKTKEEAGALLTAGLVKFGVSQEGRLNLVDLPDERNIYAPGSNELLTMPIENSLTLFDFGDGGDYRYWTYTQSIHPIGQLSGCKIIVVPDMGDKNDDTNYFTTDSSIFGHELGTIPRDKLKVYDVNFAGQPKCLVYIHDATEVDNQFIDTSVIEKISQRVDDEGELRTQLTILSNGTYGSYFVNEDRVDLSGLKTGGGALCVGDIIRAQVKNNLITHITVDFDSDINVKAKNGKSNAQFNVEWANPGFQTGKMYSRNGTSCYITPEVEGAPDERVYDFTTWQKLRNYTIKEENTVIVTRRFDENGVLKYSSVEPATLSEIKTYYEAGAEEADYCVLRMNNLTPRNLVVYRDFK